MYSKFYVLCFKKIIYFVLKKNVHLRLKKHVFNLSVRINIAMLEYFNIKHD